MTEPQVGDVWRHDLTGSFWILLDDQNHHAYWRAKAYDPETEEVIEDEDPILHNGILVSLRHKNYTGWSLHKKHVFTRNERRVWR